MQNVMTLYTSTLLISLLCLRTCLAVISWDQYNFISDRIRSLPDNQNKTSQPTNLRRTPVLPERYQAHWNLYVHPLDNPSPWYPLPPSPYEVGRGATYYDSTIPALLEDYEDFCLPIFGELGYHWSCSLLHVKDTSYVVSNDESAPYGPCCIWRQPWKVPSRDFVKVMKYDRTDLHNGYITEWYTLGPPDQVYSYGFAWNFRHSIFNPVPGTFAFPLDVGWAGQDFFNVTETIKDESVFKIPESCRDASYCVGPPV